MIVISFLGDISLNDEYVQMKAQGLSPFADVSPILQDSDLVVGNLECTVESPQGENEAKVPRLKTTIETLAFLRDLKLDLALLANNHVADNLTDGFKRTVSFLENEGIAHIGASTKKESFRQPFFWEKQGLRFVFLNCVHPNTNPKVPQESAIQLNYFDIDSIVATIKKHRAKNDFIVVCPHWGGDFEGGWYPNPIQSFWAEKMIEAGASLVIGHHSHTFQPWERLEDKYVFHSLGNFCFADIPRFGYVVNRKKSLTSAIVQIKIIDAESSPQIELIPIRNDNGFIRRIKKLEGADKRNQSYQKLRQQPYRYLLYKLQHRYLNTLYGFFFNANKPWYKRLGDINWRRIKYYLIRQ